MKHLEENVNETVNEVVENEVNTDAIIKVIASDCETGYAIVDGDNIIPCDKIVPYQGREVIHLPSNSSNRQWIDKKRVDAAIAADGELVLTYKASIKLGSVGPKIPNLSLVEKYLSEEEVATFKEIVKRAQDAKAADKAKPLTDLEKAKRAADRAQAKLAKLLEEANGGNN